MRGIDRLLVNIDDVYEVMFPENYFTRPTRRPKRNFNSLGKTHMKIAVDQANSILPPQWFCMGDVNRNPNAKYTRGGGVVSLITMIFGAK